MSQAAAFILGAVNNGAPYNRTARVYYSPWDQYVFIDSASAGFSQLMAGTSDFCIEMFASLTTTTSQGVLVGYGRYASYADGNQIPIWNVTINNNPGSEGIAIYNTSGSSPLGGLGPTAPYPYPKFSFSTPTGMDEEEAPLLQEWHHFAWIRKDNTLQFYIDGVPCEQYNQYWSNSVLFEPDRVSPWFPGKVEHFNNYSGQMTEIAFEAGQAYLMSQPGNTNWFQFQGTSGTLGGRFIATGPGTGIGTNVGPAANGGTFVAGVPYVITSLGNTNWGGVGAGFSPFIGQNFVATGSGSTLNGMFTPNQTITLTSPGQAASSNAWYPANWGILGVYGFYASVYDSNWPNPVTPDAPGDFTPNGSSWGLLDTLVVGNYYLVTNLGNDDAYWTQVGCPLPVSLGQVFQCTGTGNQGADQAAVLVAKPGSLTVGAAYQIVTIGNTDWTAIGCRASPQKGDVFIATGAGGSGTTGVAAPTSSPVSDGSFIVGRVYQITTPGTTNWTSIGAANNNQCTIFIASGTGTGGTGNAVPASVGATGYGPGGGTALSTVVSKSTTLGYFESGSSYLITDNGVMPFLSTFVSGQTYWITVVGPCDWSLVGATSPYSVGQSFVGNGTTAYGSTDGYAVSVDWSTVGATSTPTPAPAVGTVFTATGTGTAVGTSANAWELTSTTPVSDGSFVAGTLYTVATVGDTNWTVVGSTGVVGSQFIATGAGTSGKTGTVYPIVSAAGYGNVADGSLIVGMTYVIKTVGTTSWTSIGASANTVGTLFTATATGTGGTGVAVQSAATSSGTAIKDLGAGNPYSFTGLPSLYGFGGPAGGGGSQEPYDSPYNVACYWRNYRYTVGNAVYTPNGTNGSFTPPPWSDDLVPVTGTQILMVPGSGVSAPTTNGGTYANEALPTTALTIQSKWTNTGTTTIVSFPESNLGLALNTFPVGTNTTASYTATNATTASATPNGVSPVIGTTFGSFSSGAPTLIRNTSSTALNVSNLSFFIEGWVWIPVSPDLRPRIIVTAQTTNSVGIVIGDSATAPTTVDKIGLMAFPGTTVQYSANVIWSRGAWNYFAVQREVNNSKQSVWFWAGVQNQYAAKLLKTIGTQNNTIFNYAAAGAAGVSIGGISTGASASDFGINLLNVMVDAVVPNIASFGPATNSTGTGTAVARGIPIPYITSAVTTKTTLVMGFQGTNGGTTFNNQTS